MIVNEPSIYHSIDENFLDKHKFRSNLKALRSIKSPQKKITGIIYGKTNKNEFDSQEPPNTAE